jgi:hypothetical protein
MDYKMQTPIKASAAGHQIQSDMIGKMFQGVNPRGPLQEAPNLNGQSHPELQYPAAAAVASNIQHRSNMQNNQFSKIPSNGAAMAQVGNKFMSGLHDPSRLSRLGSAMGRVALNIEIEKRKFAKTSTSKDTEVCLIIHIVYRGEDAGF